MAPSEDQEQLARVRAGDETAFEALFHAHYRRLVVFAYGYVHSYDIAQDLVADLFSRMWRERETLSAVTSVKAYLYAAVRNRAHNYRRDRARETSLDVLAESPEGAIDASSVLDESLALDAQIQAVRRFIDTLPPGQRRIMTLRWHDGLTIDEIAHVMAVSRNAVDKQLSRALAKLRAAAPTLFG